jgi:hypothetical protein
MAYFYLKEIYVLDLLKETGKLGAKPAHTPMEINNKHGSEQGEPLSNIG